MGNVQGGELVKMIMCDDVIAVRYYSYAQQNVKRFSIATMPSEPSSVSNFLIPRTDSINVTNAQIG